MSGATQHAPHFVHSTALSYLGLSRASLQSGEAEYALLDVTNGFVTTGVTLREYPREHYAYVLTQDWPQIPRWFNFEPSERFRAVVPFDAPQGGRRQLYDACSADLASVHHWAARLPY